MSYVPGGAIKTLKDIQLRCVVDEITECWEWTGARTGRGNPSAWYPALERSMSLGAIIHHIRTGERSGPDYRCYCTCTTKHCVNPDHRELRKVGASNYGRKYSPYHCARISQGKRATAELTDAQVQEIRESESSTADTSARYGIDASYVRRIRTGKARRPLMAAGASIFNLGA